MASGSKKFLNKPLTKEEQKAEELKDEIIKINCGFYYEGMKIDEMQMILNELKKTKENNSQDVEDAPVSTLASEPESVQKISQESSYSYKRAMVGNNSSAASTSNEDMFDKTENSPDPSNKIYGKNLNNEHNHDSELIEKNSNLKKDGYPELNKSNSRSPTSEYKQRLRPRKEENKANVIYASRKVCLERWRLDPLLSVEEDDVPLELPERKFIHQEEYFPNSNEDLDETTFDALCKQMSEKLDNLHEQIITNERQTIWGSPIKVSSKWNSPTDKNLFMETTSPSTSHVADISVRDTFERTSKRKALHIIAAVQKNYSNDENSDDEFANTSTKKRKCQQGKKADEVSKKIQEDHENRNNSNLVEMIEVTPSDDISDPEFDSSDLKRVQIKNKTFSLNQNFVENEEYPRRVIPPNPGKKNCKGPRYTQRKRNFIQSQSTALKNSDSLSELEIVKRLNEPEPESEKVDDDCIEITDEIKPAPLSKGMQKKINNAQLLLENKKNANEKKIKDEEEARKRKEMEEKMKQNDLISKRLQEQEDEQSRQLEKERMAKNQELFYNNLLGSQKSVTSSNYSNYTKRNYSEMSEDVLLADDDNNDDIITLTHSNSNTRSCPICQNPFPAEKIESHASECNLFPEESNDIRTFQPSTSFSSRDTYDCMICNKYVTHDGQRYEEHISKCKESAEDRRRNGNLKFICKDRSEG